MLSSFKLGSPSACIAARSRLPQGSVCTGCFGWGLPRGDAFKLQAGQSFGLHRREVAPPTGFGVHRLLWVGARLGAMLSSFKLGSPSACIAARSRLPQGSMCTGCFGWEARPGAMLSRWQACEGAP
ncbi:hypothetical protein CXK94_19845 [Stutzerimonas stutzeri]|uniref:Uncharacterized protein n=1 Tax=Stutzerimonas stutzeri TaxID=316 RepID=A0A2N8STD7_STUST|nr:hypothetical protein CXK94_19845 [Stutzerimonas stutzeri]